MSKYRQYKHIKLILEDLTYKGYPLARVCGSQLAMLVWKPSIYLVLNYLGVGVKGLFDKLNSAAVNGLIVTYSTQRADYLDLIARYFPNAQPIYVRPQSHWRPNFRAIPKIVKSLLQAIALIKCKFGWSLINYIKAVLAVAVVIRLIDEVEKNNINCTQYVAFNSSYLAESILAWYFRLRNINTVSLQHGMYAKYIGQDIPMDVINYENVCANEIWLWGKYSYLQVKSFLPSDCKPIIKGYPIPQQKERKAVDAVYVLLPRDIYLHESLQLLDLLKNHNYQFIIRPHPSALADVRHWMSANASHNLTLEEGGTISQNMAETLFYRVISFNSTAVFEAILAKQNIIIFNCQSEFEWSGMPLFENDIQLTKLFTHESTMLDASYYYSPYKPVNTYLA